MKKAVLFVVIALSFVLLAAGHEGVTSFHLNGCPNTEGEIRIEMEVVPIGWKDAATNTAEYDPRSQTCKLTFFVPSIGYSRNQ